MLILFNLYLGKPKLIFAIESKRREYHDFGKEKTKQDDTSILNSLYSYDKYIILYSITLLLSNENNSDSNNQKFLKIYIQNLLFKI